VRVRTDEEIRLVKELRAWSAKRPRFGARRVHALLVRAGWRVNRKRIERLWRQEGLQVPRKRRKRRRGGGESGARRRATRTNEVWSYDFLFDRLADGRQLKVLTLVDEHSREGLGARGRRSITAKEVIELLEEQIRERGAPDFVRSDNGPEFIARAVKAYLEARGVKTIFIEPGSPWENPFIESFNGRVRDELLAGEEFLSYAEADYMLGEWLEDYNEERPHSSLGYLTPREFAEGREGTLLTTATPRPPMGGRPRGKSPDHQCALT
jgi:putative transposase